MIKTESAIIIKSYLRSMTNSELFALMTCGFSTIAGSNFVLYIGLNCCFDKTVCF